MERSIVYTVTFLIFSYNAMSFRQGWHRHWIPDGNDHHLPSQKGFFSEDDFIKETYMSNSRPDSDEMTGPEFLPHTYIWIAGDRESDLSSHEGAFSGDGILKEIPLSTSRPNSYEIDSSEFLSHHTTMKSTSMKITTIVSTKATTEHTTEYTTEYITKPLIESTTESRAKRTIKPMTQSTTETKTDTTQDLLNCIQFCPVTSEYNPVCGTNLVTYPNLGRLICAKRCGLAVDILRPSRCPTNITEIFSTSQSPSTTTPKFNTTSETLFQQECIKSCDRSSELRPVCGSNDVTYKNHQNLMCAQYCGIGVQLKHTSSCVNKNANNNDTPLTSTISVPVEITTLLPPRVSLCIKACPILTEDKPICGTNGVTYKNPSHLQCAKVCGVKVTLKTYSACPLPSVLPEVTTNENPVNLLTTSTTNAPEITKTTIDVMKDHNIINTTFNNPTTTEPYDVEIDPRLGESD